MWIEITSEKSCEFNSCRTARLPQIGGGDGNTKCYYQNNQKQIFHIFIHFKKAFDLVQQEWMCANLRKFNISQGTVNATEAMYQAAQSSVLIGVEISNWLSNQVGETINAEMEKCISAFEMNCMQRLLLVKHHKQAQELMERYIGKQEQLLATVKRRKLQWFGHCWTCDEMEGELGYHRPARMVW